MLNYPLVILYALMPVALLTSAKAPSALFYLILVAALALWASRGFDGAREISGRYKGLLISYSVLLGAVILSTIAYSHWPGANGEGALRFFLGMWLLLLALSQIDRQFLRHSLWGMYVAGLIGTGIVLWLIWPHFGRPNTISHNSVTFGNLMLIMAVISIFSIKFSLTPWPRAERVFKLVVAAVIVAGFILTQARSGWIAMPLFIFLGVLLFAQPKNLLRTLLLTMVGLAIAVGVFASSDTLRNRASLAYKEVLECQGDSSTVDSSVCVRLQLWRAALDMAERNPWVGIGAGKHFPEQLKTESLPKGLVSPFVASGGFGEPHNDILFLLAVFGIPGGLGLLLIYLAPAWYFAKRLAGNHPQEIRAAAAMGMAFCLGFMVFGFTELMFRRMHTIGFYTLFVALFLILSDPEKKHSMK